MAYKITKAMLLAAGLGTRLSPLTLTTPKPLLPLNGTLLIEHQLRYLASHGIKDVVINLHHLGEKIRLHVGVGSRYGINVTYSEEPLILGTGGGIKKACESFDGPLVVLNADALIACDISALIKHHVKSNAVATMVLKELSEGDGYEHVGISKNGLVTGFGSGKYFYTGLQILGPEMLGILPPAGTPSCLIEDGYRKILEQGQRVAAFIYNGYFNDLGTPDRYEKAKRDIKAGKFRVF